MNPNLSPDCLKANTRLLHHLHILRAMSQEPQMQAHHCPNRHNPRSLTTNLVLLPCVVVGILLGWQILKRIPQKPFEWTLFVLTLIAALWLVSA